MTTQRRRLLLVCFSVGLVTFIGAARAAEPSGAVEPYPWRPFEKVHRPATPTVNNKTWVRNPIDAFLAAEHEAHGLTPRPEAPKALLLRRVYLDLIGLPPTREELHAFLDDPSSDAYEKVVDRLLDSPQYGERWGRHWMDVWRYSDWAGWTGGNQIRDSQPHIWRWRDWIVESLNRDKGYDRMILEMLAADELCPDDTDALRATGYLVRNYKMLSRETWMQEVVDHTFQGFLGVTLGCARCHDHPVDPIKQPEYYRVRAVFEPHQVRIDRVPGELDTKNDGLARVYDADLQAKTYLYVRGDERTPDKTKALEPGTPAVLGGQWSDVTPLPLPPSVFRPDKRPYVLADLRKLSEREMAAAKERKTAAHQKADALAASFRLIGLRPIATWLAERCLRSQTELAGVGLLLAYRNQEELETLLRVEELEDAGRKGTPEWESAARLAVSVQRTVAALEARYEFLALAQTVPPKQATARAAWETKRGAARVKLQKATDALYDPLQTAYRPRPNTGPAARGATYPDHSTGRRLALACWIADKDNPLTARVAMNHLWMRHFGRPLVPSVFDFGKNGQKPTHPALLDWLADEFMARAWSMKAMHRLIVTSNAYRMASTPDETNAAIDRDNKYLWRMPSRRLEAEAVRDGVFYVAGRLDLTMGGPDLDHEKGLAIPRRSLYFRTAAEKQMEFLKIFDCAAVTECYQRKESIQPQQALALANSELTRSNAWKIAEALTKQLGSDPATFVTAAFEQVLCRAPTAEERAECATFLEEWAWKLIQDAHVPRQSAPAHARASLIHVLLNHHEFVTIR
jgi:hypothetical protein